MVGDTIKSEFPPVPKMESDIVTPEVKAEITRLVEEAMTQMRAQSVLKPESAQAERQVLKETTATLEAELATTRKQVQDACIVLNSFKSELDTQSASYAAKVQQFEQRIAALSEQEASLRTLNVQLCADRDMAIRREQQLVLSKDQLTARNLQLSRKLTDTENEYALKATTENEYWRQYYASSASTSHGQPPSAVYFSIPQMPNRRNTVPDISTAPQYASFRQPNQIGPHGQKRPRVDSIGSSVSAATADPPGASNGSEAFKLRPVQPLALSHGTLRGSQSSTVSQPGPSPTQATGAASFSLPRLTVRAPLVSPVLPASALSAVSPVSPVFPAPRVPPVPASPTVIRLEPAPQPPVLPPSKSQLSSVAQPTKEPVSPTVPPHIQQLLRQLFPVSATGQRECKLCKNRPEGINGAPLLTSFGPAECLAHAEKYHSRVLTLLKARFPG
ncbi:hypothetical protein FRC08_012849 [Ceratobasidium sp. 394]|nr:hypothetical protein FRC08_012849 [Ceratobasidium sp. 394]